MRERGERTHRLKVLEEEEEEEEDDTFEEEDVGRSATMGAVVEAEKLSDAIVVGRARSGFRCFLSLRWAGGV